MTQYKHKQGSRLTFQLASPVASDRFDSLAKTNFSLARFLNIHHCIQSSKCYYMEGILENCDKTRRAFENMREM